MEKEKIKKVETKKASTATVAKPVEAKKPATPKVETKKVEPKKIEAKKPETKKKEVKKVEAKKVAEKKPATKAKAKAPAKKVEKKAAPVKAKKADNKKKVAIKSKPAKSKSTRVIEADFEKAVKRLTDYTKANKLLWEQLDENAFILNTDKDLQIEIEKLKNGSIAVTVYNPTSRDEVRVIDKTFGFKNFGGLLDAAKANCTVTDSVIVTKTINEYLNYIDKAGK